VRCLTLRSSRRATAGHTGRVAPMVMLHHAAGASCRRTRLTSNVRQRENLSLEMPRTSAAPIASSSLSCKRRGEHGGTQNASEDFTRTASALTSFGVRGLHGWLASAAKTVLQRHLPQMHTGHGTHVLSRSPGYKSPQLSATIRTPRCQPRTGRQSMAATEVTVIHAGAAFVASSALPNHSVKPTCNGRPHRPRGAHGHVAPRGRCALPSHAAYLKR